MEGDGLGLRLGVGFGLRLGLGLGGGRSCRCRDPASRRRDLQWLLDVGRLLQALLSVGRCWGLGGDEERAEEERDLAADGDVRVGERVAEDVPAVRVRQLLDGLGVVFEQAGEGVHGLRAGLAGADGWGEEGEEGI